MPHYEQGKYRARVLAQGFSESKEKKTPYFFLDIEPFEAEGPTQMPDKVFTRTIKLYCTDTTIEYTIDKLRRLGWKGRKIQELEPGVADHHSFVDQEIDVECQHEGQYDNFQLARDSVGNTAQPGIAAKLDKLFGKMVASTAAKAAPKNGATKQPTKTAEPAAASDDDDPIPF